MNVDEWIRQLQWIPPYHKNVVKLNRFIDISKGQIVIVEIERKPESLEKLKEWIEYRKEIGKPLIVARTYLSQAKTYAVMVKMHDDDFPVFISLPELDVYVKRTALTKSQKIRSTLRYALYYSGYKLKYRYTHIPAHRYTKTEQCRLTTFV